MDPGSDGSACAACELLSAAGRKSGPRVFFWGIESSKGYVGQHLANDPKTLCPCKRNLLTMFLYGKRIKNKTLFTKLSGGEIKRIEIATVLLRKARVMVFDEPEAGIDLWSFNNLIRVFETIRDRRDCSLIVISHQERILSIADEIVMIQNGKVGLSGDRSSIFPRLLCKNDCDERGTCVRFDMQK